MSAKHEIFATLTYLSEAYHNLPDYMMDYTDVKESWRVFNKLSSKLSQQIEIPMSEYLSYFKSLDMDKNKIIALSSEDHLGLTIYINELNILKKLLGNLLFETLDKKDCYKS